MTPNPAPPPKWVMPPILIYSAIGVILLLAGAFGLSTIKTRLTPAAPTPTVMPLIATPTPVQPVSVVATQSAFLQFAASVASLSAAVAVPVQDQTLAPPVISLPLGY